MNTRELLIDTAPLIQPERAHQGLHPEDAERRLPSAAPSIAEIVAHVAFWREWFGRRAQGIGDPMAARAAQAAGRAGS